MELHVRVAPSYLATFCNYNLQKTTSLPPFGSKIWKSLGYTFACPEIKWKGIDRFCYFLTAMGRLPL